MGFLGIIVLGLVILAVIIGVLMVDPEKQRSMLKRTAVLGSMLTGFGGWVMAINSMTGGEEIGAGICLFASAAAFGVVAFLAAR